LLVGIPLLHWLHVLVVAVGRSILLEVVVGRGVGVVGHRRVCLRRNVGVGTTVVLLLGLPAPRHIRTGHHERLRGVASTVSAGKDQATNL
jgi:hypothetical protein